MSSVPGVDHPEEQTEAEVTLPGRGIAISSRVQVVHVGFITVRPSVSEFIDGSVVRVGDPVEVYWTGEETQRVVPAEITEVEPGAAVRWRMRVTGPAETCQRRLAVRGRLTAEVVARHESIDLAGTTIDISEAGLRAEFQGLGAPPEAGATVALTLQMDDDAELRTPAEVVRTQARGARWIMSIRFTDIPEKDQDRVRRRVFRALREERAGKDRLRPTPQHPGG
jgi:hypothetical protein